MSSESAPPAASSPEDLGLLSVRLSTFLLTLHERANELDHHDLHRHSLDRLAEILPFDAGLLAMGTVLDGVPTGHDFVLHNRPAELMASWDAVKHEDRVAAWSFEHPGQTGNFDVSGPIYDGCDAIRAHCSRWGIAHILCTAMIAFDAGLYWVMSIYREEAQRPFSEAERGAVALVVPHVFAAARRARLGQLRARSHVPDAFGQAAAIVKSSGLVLEAEPSFAALVRAAFPRWSGPLLPREITAVLPAEGTAHAVFEPIAFRVDASDDVLLLHVRRTVPADRLTPREREIAQAFSLGETHREIGERLGVSPNTVRRHLANIYDKLGIASKVELDRMLSVLA